MKAIKIYLIVVTVLLIVAIGVGVYVWYMIQHTSIGTGTVSRNTQPSSIQKENNSTVSVDTTASPTETVQPVVIQASQLSESQQKMLQTLGYTQDSYTITPAMVACVEDTVGKERLNEITKGSAPSPIESVQILPCFKK